jgi:hypothetical protein
MCDPMTLVGGGMAMLGGLMGGEGAKSAAETQAAAGREAMATQERMLAEQQKVMAPFRTAGLDALNQLVAGTQPGGEFAKPFAMGEALPTFQPFKMQESEAQKFATAKAMDAMRNQMQLGGQALSTNAITGAGELAGKIGSEYEQQAYNQWLQSQQQQFGQALQGRQQTYNEWLQSQQQRLQPLQYLSTLGESAAAGTGANIGAAGVNLSNLQTGIGNVTAAGQAGAAGAMAGGIGDIGTLLLAQGLRNPSTTPGTTPGTTPASTYTGATFPNQYVTGAQIPMGSALR